jgi:hypothetical protein
MATLFSMPSFHERVEGKPGRTPLRFPTLARRVGSLGADEDTNGVHLIEEVRSITVECTEAKWPEEWPGRLEGTKV